MMKLQKFDRPTVKALRDDLDSALARVAQKYGIKISSGNISFSNSNASIKVTAAVIGNSGMVMSKEATDFARYAQYKLPGVQLGDKFTYGGKQYTITGWKARASKNPVLAEQGGNTYRVPVELVKASV